MNFINYLPATLKTKIKQGVKLAPYTTFRIGGPAKYFIILNKPEEIIATIKAAKKADLNWQVIGSGSNLLVSDKGFDGLIIKLNQGQIKCTGSEIVADAGASLAQVVQLALQNSLSGLEFATGIPGTVGGAVWGNAGAFQHLIGELVNYVEIFDQDEIIKLNRDQCQFQYRESIFKTKRKDNILLGVSLQLQMGKQDQIKAKMADYLSRRPKYNKSCAGCVFLNPRLPYPKEELKKYDLDLSKVTPNGKISTGYLIEQLDLKGKTIGGAIISPDHGNYILNFNQATAEDVVILIGIIKQKVRNNFGIQLQEEIQYLGF